MMNSWKRLMCLALSVVMLAGMLPGHVHAEEYAAVEPVSMTYVNPLYAGIIDETDLVQPNAVAVAEDVEYCSSIQAAGEAIREQVKARQETVVVSLIADHADEALLMEVFSAALAHTGVSTEGDYLQWQYGGWEGQISGYAEGETYYLTLTYTVTYYTTAEQEAAMDTAVAELLSALDLSGAEDYGKIRGVYDWLCANVTYDHANLDDDTYKLKHTAYAALVDRTAVCQGYAVLLYRLMLELDVDCRLISGTGNGGGHAWNIVALDGVYYNVDATWDAGLSAYAYFLRSDSGFGDHTRDEAYGSDSFYAAYPMAEANYGETAEPAVVAEGTCGENLTWVLEENGTLTISGTGAMADYDDQTNKSPWYAYISQINAVVIESGVTAIGDYAFYDCDLVTVEIPDTVSVLGEGSFYECKKLTAITIPEGVTELPPMVLMACDRLASVSLPSTLTAIRDYALCWSGIPEITIPEGVTLIDHCALQDCSKLTSVTFPASLQQIGSYVVSGCDALTEVWFTGPAPAFRWLPFNKMTLTAYYPAGVASWTSDLLQDYGGTVTWKAYCPGSHTGDMGTYCTACGTYIPATGTCGADLTWELDENGTLTVSGTGAMTDYEYYTMPWNDVRNYILRVVVEDGVTHIGACAFAYCEALESVELPDSVTEMGSCAFAYCPKLYDFEIPAGVMTLEYGLLMRSAITEITVPASVTVLEDRVFELCEKLTAVEIQGSLTAVGKYIFYCCSSLESLVLPGTFTELPHGALYGCTAMTQLDLPDTVTVFGTIAINDCPALLSLDLPANLEGLDHEALSGCASLEQITIPASVTYIGNDAFDGCDALEVVTFQGDLPYMNENVFRGYEGVVRYPADGSGYVGNLKNYGGTVTWKAYCPGGHTYESVVTAPTCLTDGYTSYTCSRCGDSYVADVIPANGSHTGDMGTYCTACGAFIPYSGTCLYDLTWTLDENGTLTISGGKMADLGQGTAPWYKYRSKITRVVIEESVTNIGYFAFYNCTKLTSVEIPEGIGYIPYGAFQNCSSLASINLPDSVHSIGFNAFQNCTSLTSIELPQNVDAIGEWAFSGCTGLTSVVLSDRLTTIHAGAFSSCSGLTAMELPAGVTYIGEYAFQNCSSLASINIPDGVDNIGERAFYGCSSLNSIVIPKSVADIGESAFAGCAALTDIKFVGNAPTIDYNAFGTTTATAYYPAGDETWTDDVMQNYGGTVTWKAYCPDGHTGDMGTYCTACGTYIPATGTCGVDLTWELDENGTLTVSGTGEMTSNSSWYAYRTQIKKVVVEEGVTGLCYAAFSDCYNLTHAELPGSVTVLPDALFLNCTNLVSVTIPAGVTRVGAYAFMCCSSVEVKFAGDAPVIGEGAFTSASVTALYPGNNPTWTVDALKNYGGTASWKAYCTADGQIYETVVTPPTCLEAGYTTYTCPTCGDSYVADVIPANGSHTGDMGTNCTVCGVFIPYVGDCGEDLTWTLDGEGVLRITGSGAIPNYSQGGAPWYSKRGSITKVIIGNGVTSIGNYAFFNCHKMTSVDIGAAVEDIGASAFKNCVKLTRVEIPGTVKTISTSAFEGCTALEEAILGSGAERLGGYAFRDCTKLKTVSLPDTLVQIGGSAFFGCTALTTLDLPDSLTAIGSCAFENCTALTEVVIPDGVSVISRSMFQGCTNLVSVTLPASVSEIQSDAFNGCGALAEILLPGDLNVIEDRAFTGCKSLTSVVIPDSVYFLGEAVFQGCSGLTAVQLPDGIEEIPANFFAGAGFTAFTFPDSVTEISQSVFYGCTALEEVILPENITVIPNYLFAHCYALSEIRIPEGVTEIGREAFIECESLTAVEIPGTVTSIGWGAFQQSGLETVVLHEGLTAIEQQAFWQCESLTKVRIPGTVTAIDKWAFGICTKVEEIRFAGDAPTMAEDAFSNISATAYYPAGFDGWSEDTMADYGGNLTWKIYCPGEHTYESLVTPPTCEDIGYTTHTCAVCGDSYTDSEIPAFGHTVVFDEGHAPTCTEAGLTDGSHCSVCEKILTPQTVIDPMGHSGELGGYCSVCHVYIAADNSCGDHLTWTLDEEGILTVSGTGAMKVYIGNLPWHDVRDRIVGLVVESGVTSLGSSTLAGCFEGCVNLQTVSLPETLATIGYRAFAGCTGLKTVTIPDSVTTIEGEAFRDCTALEDIRLPAELTSIPYSMFRGCTALTEIEIPATVTTLGSYAFADCAGLTSVVLPAGLTVIDDSAFSGCKRLTSVNAPAALERIGNSAFHGCSGLTKLPFSGSLHTIGDSAFYGCTSLTNVTVSGGVTSLGNSAFANCTGLIQGHIYATISEIPAKLFWNCENMAYTTIYDGITAIGEGAYWNTGLTSVTIPEGVTAIGNQAFESCGYLTEVNLPNSLLTVGDEAFAGCSSLQTLVIPENVEYIGEYALRFLYVKVYFTGDAPTFAEKAFLTSGGGAVTAYYPVNNPTWNEETFAKYATWRPYCPEGHAYESVVTEPTCTATGYTTHTCAACGDSFTDSETEALGHSYESVVTEPTCTAAGYTTHTCAVCGDSYTDSETEKKPHSYESVVTEPTCTEYGYTTYTCADCGASYTDNRVSPGHSYEAVVTPPACAQNGFTVYTCTVCGDSYTGDWTGVLGHSYESVVTEPTCTQYGYTTYTCTVCGDSYMGDTTEMLPHSYESEVRAPTCAVPGATVHTCVNCGNSYESDHVSPTGHSYESVVTEPTCFSDGYTTYTCTICGISYTDNWVSGGHRYESVVTPPTFTEIGYTTYTCTVCGDSYVGDEVDPTSGHVGEPGDDCAVCGKFIPVEGTCGEQATWRLDEEGTLTISGQGAMNTAAERPWYQYRTRITKVVVGEGITAVGINAFKDLGKLVSAELPSSLETIQPEAFGNCRSLAEITIPAGVTQIGSCAFRNCSKLREIVIPQGVTVLEMEMFNGCTSLTAVQLPGNLKKIEANAFMNCSSLLEIRIPDSVQEIQYSTFYGCTALKKANIPTGITVIPSGMFLQCTSLTSLTIPENVWEIEFQAFTECNLTLEFLGDAPVLSEIAFLDATITAIYPAGNETWTGDVLAQNGGAASITWVPSGVPLEITKQPESVTAVVGETAVFSVEAAGEGLTYQWQWRKNDESAWSATTVSGNKTDTIRMEATKTRNGYQYRCVITDAKGNKVFSEPAILTVKEALKLAKQPESVTAVVGDTAVFSVEAAGEGLTYQWQWRKNADSAWSATTVSGNKTDTIRMEATKTRNGYQYRCVITDADGNRVFSEPATLTVKEALAITAQPESVTAKLNDTVTFTVEATGEGLTYQWQWRKNADSAWSATTVSGNKTDTIRMEATRTRNGYQYRCVITDASGNQVISEPVTLTLTEALEITKQPESVTAALNDAVTFTVEATGEGLTYQWQYRSPNGTWKVTTLSGAKTATLKLTATTARNGYQYRCIITDASGNQITSNAVTLTLQAGPAITAQPESVTAKLNDAVTFTVGATGEGLTYQWQYRSPNGTWKVTTLSGAKTATLKLTAATARNGYQYRCVITDTDGNQIISEAATLTLKEAPEIIKQPESVTAMLNDTVTFTVEATGEGLTYQWQYRSPNGTWKVTTLSGAKTAALKLTAATARNGYQYRCIITDADGNRVTTEAVTLTVN